MTWTPYGALTDNWSAYGALTDGWVQTGYLIGTEDIVGDDYVEILGDDSEVIIED